MSAMAPRAGKKELSTNERPIRIKQILQTFARAYPEAHCALKHRNPLELLIATILSAQCTDERVNMVTRALFEKYRSPQDYAEAPPGVLEEDIRSTGFFRNKAKSIRGACDLILRKFAGKVPDTLPDLIQLPGVARKTANVVLGVAFRKASGIVVDTHVQRFARRLELSPAEDPVKIERDLMVLVPQDQWIRFSHQTILHGRMICKARRPLCATCPLERICPSGEKTTDSSTLRGRP
jgi:endonuclease-3